MILNFKIKKIILLFCSFSFLLCQDEIDGDLFNFEDTKYERIRGEAEFNHKSMMKFLRKHFPSHLRRLKALRKRDKFAFRRSMTSTAKRYHHLMRMKKKNSGDYEKTLKMLSVEEEINELVFKYKNSVDENEKSQIRKKINQKLEEAFQLKEEIYQNEVKRIEERVIKAKERILKRQKNKEKIIQKRLNKLIKESDSDLEW